MLELVIPTLEDMWFREKLLADVFNQSKLKKRNSAIIRLNRILADMEDL